MIRNVGFFGGAYIAELGPVADVQLFFDCTREFVFPFTSGREHQLVDRLYKRYVRREDLSDTQKVMDKIYEAFNDVSVRKIDLSALYESTAKTRLDPNCHTLRELFFEFFPKFSRCRESAEMFYKNWQEYNALRLVISDMPRFFDEEKRDLEDYDALDGIPFWK